MPSSDPSLSDDSSEIAKLEAAGVKLRRGKSGAVLLADFTNASEVTDALVQSLLGVPRLRELTLNGKNVTDAIALVLGQLENLKTVDLSNTNITDVTLDAVAKHQHLKILELTGSQVSLERVRELRKAMIGTRIIFLI